MGVNINSVLKFTIHEGFIYSGPFRNETNNLTS